MYKPGLENKAADALLRMPPTVHLNNLTGPTMIDLAVIKEEVDKDKRLQQIIAELNKKGGQNIKYSMQQGMLKSKDRLVVSKTSKLIPMI